MWAREKRKHEETDQANKKQKTSHGEPFVSAENNADVSAGPGDTNMGASSSGGSTHLYDETGHNPQHNVVRQRVKFSNPDRITLTPKMFLADIGLPWLIRQDARAVFEKYATFFSYFRITNIQYRIFNLIGHVTNIANDGSTQTLMTNQPGYIKMNFDKGNCAGTPCATIWNKAKNPIGLKTDCMLGPCTLDSKTVPATASPNEVFTMTSLTTDGTPLESMQEVYSIQEIQNYADYKKIYSKESAPFSSQTVIADGSKGTFIVPPISQIKDRNHIHFAELNEPIIHHLPSTGWMPTQPYYYEGADKPADEPLKINASKEGMDTPTKFSPFEIVVKDGKAYWMTYPTKYNPSVSTKGMYSTDNVYKSPGNRSYQMISMIPQTTVDGALIQNFFNCQTELTCDLEFFNNDEIPTTTWGDADAYVTQLHDVTLPPIEKAEFTPTFAQLFMHL